MIKVFDVVGCIGEVERSRDGADEMMLLHARQRRRMRAVVDVGCWFYSVGAPVAKRLNTSMIYISPPLLTVSALYPSPILELCLSFACAFLTGLMRRHFIYWPIKNVFMLYSISTSLREYVFVILFIC